LWQHPRLPRPDAVKILPVDVSSDKDYRVRFEREADLASTLWLRHTVGVHDRGDADGQQLMGDAIDGRADQYSLAATAYHLLGSDREISGQRP
jgi:serine/threonine protein kinase, bacterial